MGLKRRDLHGGDALEAVHEIAARVAVERLGADPIVLFVAVAEVEPAELALATAVDDSGLSLSGMIGPVSQPGPTRKSCPLPRGRLGTITVSLSCCAP